MAKKGAAAQLQTDVYTDDDWDSLLDKSGLIVVDVYSDWCGQCSAMSAILKKLKLEIGGDLMHIAAAKCDNIKVLERFRDKSEPTWMFISDRKVVNIMFGANAPKLIATITNELRRENEYREGTITRDTKDPTEPIGEEEERYEKKEALERADREAELAATVKELDLRRNLEVEALLHQFNEVSVLLAWPHAKDRVIEIMQEQFEKYGLSVGQREKPVLTNEDIDLLEYFADGDIFPEKSKDAIIGKKTMAWIIKGGEDPANIDAIVNLAVYGPSKEPPGDPGFPAYILQQTAEDETEDADGKHKEKEDTESIYGLWCPPNSKIKAMAIRVIFKHLATPHMPPEPEEIPPYIAMAFDAFKRREVMALANEYPKEVMRFGFFTDENADIAQLIAKTVQKFEKNTTASQTEKLVIQLSKKRSDPVLAFAQLGPSFMSSNAVEGKRECKLFFPEGYDVPDEEEIVEEVKKPRKKKKAAGAAVAGVEEAKGNVDESNAAEIGDEAQEIGEQEELEENEEGEDNEATEEEGEAKNPEQSAVDVEVKSAVDVEVKSAVDVDNATIDMNKATNTVDLEAADVVPPVVVDNDNIPPPAE